jgi:putative membrane-bound dehydrogenase-like protein
MRLFTLSALLCTLAFGSRLTAAYPKPGDKPIPPKEAPGKMTVPEGFKVTLFAGEPDVVQPIAFTFDDRGRMWVVECLSYPIWSKDGKGRDRVLIFEDTDGDGTFDKRTVFLDDGVNLSGIELGFGGVWLCSLPNLIFIPLKDGEDRPAGPPQVVLDGWNMIDTKHNIFNSLGWGPDGWLYGCNGIQARSWVGAPGTPKEKRTYLDCGVWRYHPTRKVFEAVAHGTTNPFGLDWDEYGEMFVTNCVIDHLFHFVPGGHYERMYGQDANPYVYGLMKSCVDYKHWAGGDWTSSRSTGVGGDPKHSDAGGGHAHSGCAIYLGDNFPAEYRNTLFTANIHGNRLNNDGLARTPAGYKGVRRKDFLFANDSWFRGVCVKCGPDGALYVSDWCDTGECHNYDKADTSNGRIYRVSYGNPKKWKGDVSSLTDAELVKLQLSPNDWFVRHARRVLQERAATGKLEKGTADALRGIFSSNRGAPERLRGLWALSVVGGLDYTQLITVFLKDSEQPVRAWVARLLIEGYPDSVVPQNADAQKLEAFRRLMMEAFTDRLKARESPYVLVTIASALQRANKGVARELLKAWLPLLSTSSDPKLLQMVWYAMLRFPIVEELGLPREEMPSQLRQNTLRFMLTGSPFPVKGNLESILAMLRIARTREAEADVLLVIRETFAGTKPPDIEAAYWEPVYAKLLKEGDPEIVRQAEAVAVIFGDEKVIADLVRRISDTAANAEERRAVIELLVSRKIPELGKTLRGLLDDPAVRQAAIRGLAAFPDAETPAAILKAYPKFTAEEKADAVNTLAARVPWANALLDAIEKKDVPRADVPVATARQILALNDKALSARLETVWGKLTPASKERAALMKKWKELLTEETITKANPAAGRAAFTKHCAACHKMFGEGGAVGPELTGSQRANLDYVLENVLDPSAVVPNEYKLINFTLTDERVVSGIILRETKDAVSVRTANETVILPTADIAARRPTNLSIMPDGLFDAMKPEEVRDLVAYLRAREQVPVPK